MAGKVGRNSTAVAHDMRPFICEYFGGEGGLTISAQTLFEDNAQATFPLSNAPVDPTYSQLCSVEVALAGLDDETANGDKSTTCDATVTDIQTGKSKNLEPGGNYVFEVPMGQSVPVFSIDVAPGSVVLVCGMFCSQVNKKSLDIALTSFNPTKMVINKPEDSNNGTFGLNGALIPFSCGAKDVCGENVDADDPQTLTSSAFLSLGLVQDIKFVPLESKPLRPAPPNSKALALFGCLRTCNPCGDIYEISVGDEGWTYKTTNASTLCDIEQSVSASVKTAELLAAPFLTWQNFDPDLIITECFQSDECDANLIVDLKARAMLQWANVVPDNQIQLRMTVCVPENSGVVWSGSPDGILDTNDSNNPATDNKDLAVTFACSEIAPGGKIIPCLRAQYRKIVDFTPDPIDSQEVSVLNMGWRATVTRAHPVRPKVTLTNP